MNCYKCNGCLDGGCGIVTMSEDNQQYCVKCAIEMK